MGPSLAPGNGLGDFAGHGHAEVDRYLTRAAKTASGYHEMDNPNQGQDDLLTAEQTKTEGLVQARIAGLVGEPTSEFTKLTDLEEYTDTSAEGSGELGSDRSPIAGSEGWP